MGKPISFSAKSFMRAICGFVFIITLLYQPVVSQAEDIELVQRSFDPYGCPRPGDGHTNVALRTSFYMELKISDYTSNPVLADSVTIQLQPSGGGSFYILNVNQQFAPGYSGKLSDVMPGFTPIGLAVYVDSDVELSALTSYEITVTAQAQNGEQLPGGQAKWSFTTEASPTTEQLVFDVNVQDESVGWEGGFFTGFIKPGFNCSYVYGREDGYELMDEIRQQHPRAWSLQRDWSLTGMEFQPPLFPVHWPPNVVRELETRRITEMEEQPGGILLYVEDFFGHEQYGIASGRNVSEDYHIGDEVLIADGVKSERVDVSAVDDVNSTVLVESFDTNDWLIEYSGELPTEEDPNAPGLFPPGGCYLRKFDPSGTPHYYWGRVDKEYDLVIGQFGRREVVTLSDAPGDLSIDGMQFTTAKDLVEMHEVARAMTSHLIERYGDICLDFYWSVFNEPDLAAHFWRCRDWDELQRFYDYTVDGVLRAFEEHGYDSNEVLVGGLEIGAIFGVNIENPILGKFLAHCSPTASYSGALTYNAAYDDSRLDGKRSQRVEALCSANSGKGSPCDFISIHAYNKSSLMADKLIAGKELALQIDSDYFADLWVNSFESCPSWSPPSHADMAAADSYLGNGYFSTWCCDVVRRQLNKAKQDPNYSYGETILTFWPWVFSNFAGFDAATQMIDVDDNDDGVKDRAVTIALPILNFTGLLASMVEDYFVLPEQVYEGHTVSGFASRTDRDVRVLLYSHHWLDTQSRSEKAFEVTLKLEGLDWTAVRVREFRFDKEYNSIFELAEQLRDRTPKLYTTEEINQLKELSALCVSDMFVCPVEVDGTLETTVTVAGNGISFLVVESSLAAGDFTGDGRITRILWMAAATLVVLMGIFGLLMIGKIKRICSR